MTQTLIERAKQEAVELVNMYCCSLPMSQDRYMEAKRCALICCNKILDYVGRDELWEEVKVQIHGLTQ